MYQLTKEQKLSNYKELLDAKLKKVENLNKEITGLRKKIQKLEKEQQD